jgi:hypothetical protein
MKSGMKKEGRSIERWGQGGSTHNRHCTEEKDIGFQMNLNEAPWFKGS